jgi:hypothetical protein
MSTIEQDIVEMREWFNTYVLCSKEASQKFFVELGSHNIDGTLTDNYKV